MKKVFTLLGVFILGSLTTFGIAYAMINVATPFSDVDYNNYYGSSLTHMQERNVISGYSDGTFGPNDAVTRAQLVTILDRYDLSLFNANYSTNSYKLLLLLCEDSNYDELSEEGKSIYNDLCKQAVVL